MFRWYQEGRMKIDSSRKLSNVTPIIPQQPSAQRKAEVMSLLQSLGANRYDLHLPETFGLPSILHPNENVLGLVYGRCKYGNDRLVERGLLVATDQRVLFIDKKPLYIHTDELAYKIVSGISLGHTIFITTVILNTRLGPINIRTFNQNCARQFVYAIASMIHIKPEGGGPL